MGNCTCIRAKNRLSRKVATNRGIDYQIRGTQITDITQQASINRNEQNTQPRRHPHSDANRSLDEIDAPSAIVTKRPKSQKEIKVIKNSLLHHFLFNSLPDSSIDDLISKMKLYTIEAKEIIFKQGDQGNNFFVLADGSLEIIINGVVKGFIHEGNSFGELALIRDCDRTATIRSITKSQLWGIGRRVFRNALKTLSQIKFEENKAFLKTVNFLQRLTEEQLESLVAVAINQKYEDGQKIVVEGDPAESFFIILDGVVECSCKNQVFRVLNKGEYFGEQALLYNSLRTATVTAIGNVKVLNLGRELLNSVLGDELHKVLYRNTLRIAFDCCNSLKNLNPLQVDKIIDAIETFTYNNGEVVIHKGTPKGEFIWFVLKGSLYGVTKAVNLFEVIGVNWIMRNTNGRISQDYIANNIVDIGRISKASLESILEGRLPDKIYQNRIISILKKVDLFKLLPEQKLEALSSLVKIKEYNQGMIIYSQGDIDGKFYIIKEGEVSLTKNHNILRTIYEGDYFGERSILFNEAHSTSASAKVFSVIWVLSKTDLFNVMDENLKFSIMRRINLHDDSVTLNDLCLVKILGKGSFSIVYLAVNKITKALYALKIVSRKSVSRHNLQDSLSLERKILLTLNHPFIIKLVKTFKDDKRIYFLLEFVHGLVFYFALRILNILSSNSCKFYTAILLIILEHLHNNSIIYRDLKPENLMLDESGYLKLLDFGTSKIIKNRTNTVVGTPQYMAPEVITGKGYSFACDLWSLGIMIYEFICGAVPFGENDEEPYTIYKQIIEGKITYPKFVKENCKEKVIIEQLLRSSPAMRGSAQQLKQHKWLHGFSWEDLMNKKMRPPLVPEIENIEEIAKGAAENNIFLDVTIGKQELNNTLSFKDRPKIYDPDWDRDF